MTDDLAFSSKHPFVPNPAKNSNASRWLASLSNGQTVFEDVTPYIASAWRRLNEYVKVHNLKITNLRLEAYGHNVSLMPYKDEMGNAQINGYWHSKRFGGWLNAPGLTEVHSSGIGIVKGREIHVTWVNNDGSINYEIKAYQENDLGCIINDAV